MRVSVYALGLLVFVGSYSLAVPITHKTGLIVTKKMII